MQWIAESIQGLFGETNAGTTPLQKSGLLTKEQVLKFFEAGHKMFDDPMVKLKLKETAAKKQNVETVITEMQKQIFESQGIDGVFGVGFLAKIRTAYANDAEMMQELMKFVQHEEMALDEAEMTIDDFLKKLELRDWALQQYHAVQQQMKGMSPQEQRDLLHRQQLMMKEVSKESQEIMSRASTMDDNEKKAFVAEQVKKLQDRFQIIPGSETGGQGGHDCQHCQHQSASSNAQNTAGELGSVMTAEEQVNFFKALYGSPSQI